MTKKTSTEIETKKGKRGRTHKPDEPGPIPPASEPAATPAAPEATARVSELESRLEAAREETRERHDAWLRALAETENLRKRSAREIEEVRRRSREEVLSQVLAIVDDVERALDACDTTDSHSDAVIEGVRLIHTRLLEVLAGHAVRPMEVVGEVFDPRYHEAVLHEDSETHASDHVTRVLQPGYWVGERVLRPARVAVAR